MPTAATGHDTLNDDAAAALRRAIGFAGLFGLAGVAAIACTVRSTPPVAGIAADCLMAQEARWAAEANGAATIKVPAALQARRGEPAVAAALAEAQRQVQADRTAAETRRDRVIRRMDEVRADRDLRESQRSVLSIKVEQSYAERGAALARGDTAAVRTLDAAIMSLRIQAAKVTGDAAIASRTLNALGAQIMAQATADRNYANERLDTVRMQLRGG